MKNVLIGLLLLFSITANAQWPKGLPSPYSNGFIQHGYIKADSALILANRDTSWTPRFPGTVVRWKHAGVDTLLWVWDTKWRTLTSAASSGGGTGTVTSVATNTATGITGGTITTTGTLSIDTTLIETRKDRDKLKDSLLNLISATGSGTVTSVSKGFGIVHDGTITTTGTINADSTVLSTKANVQKVKDSLQTQITTNTTNIAANTTSITNNLTRLINDSTYLKSLIDAKGSGTVTSVAKGWGLVQDGTITTTGTNTVDSTLLSTKSNVQKVKDSLLAVISAAPNQSITVTATGDATGTSTSSATAPSLPLTLATVNSNVGTFTNATVTVNAKGLVTAVATGSAGTTQTTAAQTITATAGQTVFPFTSIPSTSTNFIIFVNGGKWDYTIGYTYSGNNLTTTSALDLGDKISLVQVK